MFKEHEPPKETPKQRAERKWRNNIIRKRLKDEQRKPKLVTNLEPETSDVIENTGRRAGPIHNFEGKFKKDIRAMMEGYANKNLALYLAALRIRKCQLLREKLRRLKLAQQEEASNG